jgi:nucleotide-binding universal stress UspA family protein
MITLAPVRVTFERLLVPTDFSDVSERAVEYAKSIAKQYGSQFLLTHVSQPINPIAPPEAMWIDEQAIQQQIEDRLEQRGAELRSEGVQARTISATGLVDAELLSTASKEKVDLIVLGTQALTGLDRLLFGSDAEALLRRANCPVMVIGPKAQPIGDQI